jgi:hypothetical protein
MSLNTKGGLLNTQSCRSRKQDNDNIFKIGVMNKNKNFNGIRSDPVISNLTTGAAKFSSLVNIHNDEK